MMGTTAVQNANAAASAQPEMLDHFELGNFLRNCCLYIKACGTQVWEYIFGKYGPETPRPEPAASAPAPHQREAIVEQPQNLPKRQVNPSLGQGR